MSLNLLMLLALLGFLSSGEIAMMAPPQTLSGCRERCGDVSIPYPFGDKQECFKDDGYLITCTSKKDGILKPYIGTSNIQILELSLDGKAKFKSKYYAYDCYDYTGESIDWDTYEVDMANSPFWFSPTNNTFTAIGCDTLATLSYPDYEDSMTGCKSLCSNQGSLRDGSCSGIGCCQISIPWGLKHFNVSVDSFYNHTKTSPFNPCSFAFLADRDWYTFRLSDLSIDTFDRLNIPMVMDWAIGTETCEEAKQDTHSYACGPNTSCSNSSNGPGYRCYCKHGFEGNPYHPQGCQDINECERGHNNSCYETATCHNTDGSYRCHCPDGYEGDGLTDGTRCIQNFPLLKIIVGAGASFVFVLFSICFAYWGIQRSRVIKRREKFFQQNGGLLLQQQIASRRGVQDNAGIFTIEELNKATNNFDESQIIGQGGHGTVYRGILSNGKVVAVKKSKVMDKGQIRQFINEVDILSQINHRNVVKLFGCCLEIEIPLLVYEFISNGTLFQHIHNENQLVSISWRNRLRIATETAGALSYLHSYHSTPILHRDVKSSNILLDDNYVAKLSDFGASRLAPLDQAQAMTLVQGTMGYLDPECFQTGQLIDKSDVYSFGVVLAELLTRQKPILTEGSDDLRTLAMHFVSSLKDNNLFQILEYQVLNEGNNEHIMAVSELVCRCLEVKGEDRPTMKEVTMELESLRRSYEHPMIQHNPKETESFLGESSTSSTAYITAPMSSGTPFMLPLEIAR